MTVMPRSPSLFEALPDWRERGQPSLRSLAARTGVLPSQAIRKLIAQGEIFVEDGAIDPTQIQPASLDLRLGPTAYRIRASFLPGEDRTVEDKLAELQSHAIDLAEGAVLEAGCVYLVPLIERLHLRPALSASANPKSSTGRLDVFTRLIVDRTNSFDRVPPGYQGPLYIEISPRTFSILVHRGSRLNQLRVLRRTPRQPEDKRFISDAELKALHRQSPLVNSRSLDGFTIRNGLNLRVDLAPASKSRLIGYKAKRYAGVIDVDHAGKHEMRKFWEEIYDDDNGRLILDPNEFYILASKEMVVVPRMYAAEMAPFDPMMGEYRVHYAGFFDPGFGIVDGKPTGAKAVLEVRSLDIPFVLEDGQIIGRLVYERLAEAPEVLYGSQLGSNYQAQGLKLSKHFK
jgi:dCTP deaminase